MTTTLARRRTVGDVVVGVLLIVAAMVMFGDVVLATVVSTLLLGWTALVSGAVLVARTLLRMRSGASWTLTLGGVVLVVLGLYVIRNPGIGALTLTLVAGSLFLTSGLIRMASAWASPELRGLLVVSGLVSLGLGVFVLLNLTTATLGLLGTLLAIQTLIEGVTLVAVGRPRRGGTPRGAEPR
ncbi:DUF308 domain-containing protein [Blastococcus xanthinilyticus]|uniref:Uncharacterized membrane protein HdeD (DUF308 family) n=1 Tax=Blastococcus xanthinilyticus TaxID=1564164 RepID=A0A5S5CMN6_9ACTN|nr:DUF308 domain-containing protein [Blastococcus xanthinilyticus]TYP81154.1 uncharacterized membrane protein HdeD (DUF308 family) [Blastococcus xanthinilyticus]